MSESIFESCDCGLDNQACENGEETVLAAVSFVGSTLAPLFLNDPGKDDAAQRLYALSALDASELACEWPFVADDLAKADLCKLVVGLSRLKAEDSDADALDELIWEYRRLFVGPAAKAAPPWGSVYTDQQCVVFGKTTLDLREWMAQHGIRRLADDKMPEDHIGLMLAMMSWIALNRPELLDEYLQDHFLTWAPHFLEGLGSATRHPFYVGLADLTRDSLEGIRLVRGLEVVYPHFYR